MNEKKRTEHALCFVPEMLVDYLNKSNIKILQPASFFLHGVCLLVDISGFTKLSGQFCDQGKAGIDELQLATNGFMGQLVDIIYTFGGDIIKFAGDAIICVFTADYTPNTSNKPMRRSSMGSFSTGMTELMQKLVNDLETTSVEYSVSVNTRSSISAEVVLRVMHCAKLLTDVQTDKLTVHVAMSCGEMCFGILGGFENRWECLISGPCIHQLSGCLDDAPSKHAVMSRRCARIVREELPRDQNNPFQAITTELDTSRGKYSFALLPLVSGNCRIVATSFIEYPTKKSVSVKDVMRFEFKDSERNALIQPFVPLPIAEQLDNGTGLNYLAEIREVTTMFMKWDSYDANGKHMDLLELQACFYQAQRILHNTGAYLRQFLVDDKGCVLIGCWGMPHFSYLDNAHRAVTAAAQIRIACYQLGMKCSFGITTGDVYCGTVGSALRMEYAAIGSVVNMSARLMCKANGGILIDDTTFGALSAKDSISFQQLDPIRVKGRDEPLQVYSYVESGQKHTLSKASDDMDIPQYCRFPLKELLLSMADPRSPTAGIAPGRFEPATCGSSISRMLRAKRSAVENTLAVVLIEGKAGSGRTSVVTWLKKQATECNIQTSCVRLVKKDTSVEYGLFKKLFVQLMPKDLFLNNHTQRGYVQELLRLAYPKLGRSQGFAALQLLGVTCTIEDSVAKESTGASMRKQFVWSGSSQNLTSPLEHIHHIFLYLLRVHPALVIIEGLELADSVSLDLLLKLGNHSSPSAIVCTSLAEKSELDITVGNTTSLFGPRNTNKRPVRTGNSVWARHYRENVLALKNTRMITLKNYTPEEINKLLCEALGVRSVPSNVAQLVQDFSGGSYFWVREILHFIKEHGTEQFTSAVGETDAISPLPNENNHLSSFLRIKSPESTSRRSSFDGEVEMSTNGSNSGLYNVRASLYNSVHGSVRLRRGNSGCNTYHETNTITVTTTNKQLDHLLLIRFGNLLQEEQRVLRKASVIGVSFTTSVLFSLLSPHLQEHFSECLQTLVYQKWIYQDLTCDHTYQFVHGHVRQLVYELTPPSERSKLHLLVVDHLVQTYPDDPTQFFNIWYHYRQCNTDQALQYAARAVVVMLQSEDIHDCMDCFDVLVSSVKCCKTLYDVYVLQHLTNQLHTKVIKICRQPSAHPTQSRKWWHYVVPKKTAIFGNSSISSSDRVTKYSQVLPEKRSKLAIDTCDIDQSVNAEDQVASKLQVYKNKNTPATSNVSTVNEQETCTCTKQHFLAKIDAFRYQLSEKILQLGTGLDANAEEINKSEPREWQRAYLNVVC